MTSRLQQNRLALGLSLAALAKDLQCSITELALIEAGRAAASPALAQRLLEYFYLQEIDEAPADSSLSVRPDSLPAVEQELLDCYRCMREGQKRVLFELARLMSLEGKGND